MKGYIAGKHGTILKSVTGGVTWWPKESGTNQNLTDAFFTTPDSGFITCQNLGMILKTVDEGLNWNSLIIDSSLQISSISFANSMTGLLSGCNVYDEGAIYKTDDGGTTWTSVIEPGYGQIESICVVSPENAIAVGQYGMILITVDGGIMWNEKLAGFHKDYFLDIDFPTSETGYAVSGMGYDYGLLMKTTDGGQNWDTLFSGTNRHLLSICFPENDIGFVCGERDTILTNKGIFTQQPEIKTQNTISVFQNPASNVVGFQIKNTDGQFMSVKIFEIRGRELETLINDKFLPGEHIATVNVSKFKSGIYFYRIETESQTSSGRLIVVR